MSFTHSLAAGIKIARLLMMTSNSSQAMVGKPTFVAEELVPVVMRWKKYLQQCELFKEFRTTFGASGKWKPARR
jgi:hypothetical protein